MMEDDREIGDGSARGKMHSPLQAVMCDNIPFHLTLHSLTYIYVTCKGPHHQASLRRGAMNASGQHNVQYKPFVPCLSAAVSNTPSFCQAKVRSGRNSFRSLFVDAAADERKVTLQLFRPPEAFSP
jgi:hypothetical protein